MSLHGRHVLVTGTTGTIGRALASEAAGRGARLTVTARTPGAVSELAGSLGAHGVTADLASPGGPASLVAAAEQGNGPVDVLVLNAGVETVGRLEELSTDEVAATVALNLTAPLELARIVLPGLRARGSGHLVLVSSLAGVATFPGLTVYGATKAALTQAAAGLRLDLAGSGVGTTLVEVGPVRSSMMDRVREHAPTAAAFRRVHGLRALRDLDAHEVARATLDAVDAGRPHVRLPRRAAPLAAVAGAPRALVRLVLAAGSVTPTHRSPR